MSFEWVSVYECGICGTSDCGTTVAYDQFGYPVCKQCTITTRGSALRN